MKKGFTLIELLAVIAILAVISVIAYPKVIDTIGASRLTAYNVSKSNIVDAAKLKYLADVNSTSITEYTVQDLIDTGYIKKGTKNPLTDEDYDNNTKVLITNNNGVVRYEYVEGKTLYDYVSTKSEKENVYKVNNEFVYKGKDSLNYVSFNKDIYRLVKVDMYRCAYLVKETDEKIDKQNIEEYENGTINFNYQENGEIALKDDAVFYKVDNRVRKVWEVTIYYDYYKYKENGAERYVYYVDCTTGEIIGGSRWNGAKRQIESLMNDTYNYIKN